MMKPAFLGDQELEVLRHVADHAPVTVRDVADQWGEPRGLARTTISTMMERLRKKGHLVREKGEGGFRYAPAVAKSELLQSLVQQFVERTLDGSLSPFVAYLADARGLSDAQVVELRRLVQEIGPDER